MKPHVLTENISISNISIPNISNPKAKNNTESIRTIRPKYHQPYKKNVKQCISSNSNQTNLIQKAWPHQNFDLVSLTHAVTHVKVSKIKIITEDICTIWSDMVLLCIAVGLFLPATLPVWCHMQGERILNPEKLNILRLWKLPVKRREYWSYCCLYLCLRHFKYIDAWTKTWMHLKTNKSSF